MYIPSLPFRHLEAPGATYTATAGILLSSLWLLGLKCSQVHHAKARASGGVRGRGNRSKASKKPVRKSTKPKEPQQKISAATSMDVIKVAQVLLSCTLYMIVGPALILVNKHILKDLGFGYPMFISGLGLTVTGGFAQLIVRLGYSELKHSKTVTLKFWLTKIVPAGAGTALSHTFGNAAYMYISVSLVQMLKSFTPAVIMIILGVLKIDVPTKEVVVSVTVLCLGTAVASYGEMNMNWIGFGMMVCAALSESTKLVLTQFLLKNLKFGAIEGQYYLAPASALCILIGSTIVEVPVMIENGEVAIIANNFGIFCVAGLLGLAINHVSMLVIQQTSSVTIKVLGMVRNAVLVLFSVFVQGEQVTGLQFFGYAITLGGFAAYNYYKMTQGKSAPVATTDKQQPSATPALNIDLGRLMDLDKLQAAQKQEADAKMKAKAPHRAAGEDFLIQPTDDSKKTVPI